MTRRFGLTCFVLIHFLATAPHVEAIGYYDTDFDELHPNGGAFTPPAGLLKPSSQVQASIIGQTPGFRGGTIVAADWILTARHTTPPVESNNVVIDGIAYKVAERHVIDELSGVDGRDLGLIRIVRADNGGAVDFSSRAASVVDDPALTLPGTAITFSGTSASRKYSASGAQITPGFSPAEVRWGRNILSLNRFPRGAAPGSEVYARFDSDPQAIGHLQYEGLVMEGESGGGWFARDGWDWRVISSSSADVPIMTGTSALYHANWIQDRISTPATSSPVPSADNEWQMGYGVVWNPSFWSAGAPTAAQSVWINGGPILDTTSGAATAKNLFLGVDGNANQASDGLLTIEDEADLEVVDTVYLGVEAGDSGMVIQNGGTVKSAGQYVGFRGIGTYIHRSGENIVDGTLSIGRSGGDSVDYSKYTLYAGNGSVRAGGLHIAAGAGSAGQFQIRSGGTQLVETDVTVVGGYGSGTFTQAGGTHRTNDLFVGYGGSGVGSYSLTSGTLSTETINIGATSAFHVSGGLLELREFTGKDSGTINFNGSSANLSMLAEGILDYSSLPFANNQNATLSSQSDSLILLKSGSTPFGSFVNNNALQPHVIGNDLEFNQFGFTGTGVISDAVSIGGVGYMTAAPQPYVNINGSVPRGIYVKELELSGSATVSVVNNSVLSTRSGGIRVTSGSPTIVQQGEFSLISIAAGSSLEVKSGAHLTINGVVIGGSGSAVVVESGAVLRVGAELSTLTLSRPLTVQAGGELEIDVSSEGSDYVEFPNTNSNFAGTLSINVPSAAMPERSQLDLVMSTGAPWASSIGTIRAGVDGDYGSINSIIVPSPTSPLAEQVAMAVLYPKDYDGGVGDFNLGQIAVDNPLGIFVRATLPGDLNGDNSVTFADWTKLQASYNQPGTFTYADGDLNGDGTVTFSDFSILQAFYGKTWVPGGPNSIPEPGSAGLAGLAFMMVTLACRTRQANVI